MPSGSVVISVLVHAVVITVAVIAPLVAADILPAIHRPMSPFVRAFRAADIPLLAPDATPRTRVIGAPTEAPDGITPEQPGAQAREGIAVPFGVEGLAATGLPTGFGGGEVLVPAPPPPPPPPPAEPVVPVRVGGRVKAPTRTVYAAPVYPAIAISAHLEGDVTLEALIDVNGAVQDLRVVRGVPLLEQAALEAVRRWRYTPTLLNGVPVPVVMTVTVSFRLR